LKKYQQQGVAALQECKRTGAPASLSAKQLGQLVTELNKGAIYRSFNVAIWTRPRVNKVIKKLIYVSYYPSQVGRILTKLSWSRQKPQRKASNQDPEAVAQWRDKRLPHRPSDLSRCTILR